MSLLIGPTTAAFDLTGNNAVHVPTGKYATFMCAGLTGVDLVELKSELIGSITDSSDVVDATKKILNAANNTRRIAGPITINAVSLGTTGTISLHVEHK